MCEPRRDVWRRRTLACHRQRPRSKRRQSCWGESLSTRRFLSWRLKHVLLHSCDSVVSARDSANAFGAGLARCRGGAGQRWGRGALPKNTNRDPAGCASACTAASAFAAYATRARIENADSRPAYADKRLTRLRYVSAPPLPASFDVSVQFSRVTGEFIASSAIEAPPPCPALAPLPPQPPQPPPPP